MPEDLEYFSRWKHQSSLGQSFKTNIFYFNGASGAREFGIFLNIEDKVKSGSNDGPNLGRIYHISPRQTTGLGYLLTRRTSGQEEATSPGGQSTDAGRKPN